MADTIKDITELVPNVDRGSGRSSEFWMDFGIIVGAAFIVTAGVMIWAKFFRTRRRRRYAKAIPIMGNDHERDVAEEEHPRRRRRSHGEHFTKRNPTLAQTGGLPPLRPEPDESSEGLQPPSAGQLPS